MEIKCALCSKLDVVIFFGIIRKQKKHECSKEKPKKMLKKQQPKNGKNEQFNKTGKFTVMASIQPILPQLMFSTHVFKTFYTDYLKTRCILQSWLEESIARKIDMRKRTKILKNLALQKEYHFRYFIKIYVYIRRNNNQRYTLM